VARKKTSEHIEKVNLIGKQNSQMSLFEEQEKKIEKGDLLEYRIKRLFFAMGYFSKIGILVTTSQDDNSDPITDLDVYGIYLHKNFSKKTIWADCKSGNAQPLARIPWIAGIREMAHVDQALFVKKGIRLTTKKFASNYGIQILDLDNIEKLENDYSIEKNDWRGSWNPQVQQEQSRILTKIMVPENTFYKRLGKFMSTDYWTLDKYTKIKKIITALKELSSRIQYPMEQREINSLKWSIFQMINLFMLATLEICNEVYYLSNEDRKIMIFEGLATGTIPSNKVDEIVKATNGIIDAVYNQFNANSSQRKNNLQFKMNPPDYADAYIDFIERIIDKPLEYFDVLRFMDFTFMEYDLNMKEYNKDELSKLFGACDKLISSEKTIIHFICYVTRIPKDIFMLLNVKAADSPQ
jgi:hypothetical protein